MRERMMSSYFCCGLHHSSYCPECRGEICKERIEYKSMKYRQCFVNVHCSYDCPNFQIDMANDRYGYGIADDMGLEKVNCKDCHYNSGRCDDCLFEHSEECPEYKENDK